MNSIVLVDDAGGIRRLARWWLERSKQFDVVAEGSSGVDAVELAAHHHPDIVLLDVSMKGMDGLEAIPLVITASPTTKVVMYSGFEEEGLAKTAISLGAAEFIQKSEPMSELAPRLLRILGVEEDAAPNDPSVEPIDQSIMAEHLERFRTAFDLAAIGMGTMTLTGRIVRANRALEELCDRADPGLVGSLFLDLVEERDVDRVRDAIDRVSYGSVAAHNVTHRLSDDFGGAWVISTISAVGDAAGRPLYLFAQVQDVTERRAAAEELRQSEERFRLLVESVSDYAIFMLDPDGHVSSWNRGAQRIKGWSADEIIGQHFRVFYPQEARDSRYPEYELRVATATGRFEDEGWRVRKDGTVFWALVVITAVRDGDGKLIGFAKVTRDVTDRRQVVEDRERVARERMEFLAMTAHELRGPINLIHGFADLLSNEWRSLPEGEREEMMSTLVRTSSRLRHLVEDLLTASRLEAGALAFNIGTVALEPMLRTLVAEQTKGTKHDVRVEVEDGLRVHADPSRLQQMVGNLLGNAVLHGASPVEIAARAVDGAAEISVRDAGPGVAPDMLPRLFEKFAHGGREESNGLGLYIVRELAHAHGGDARHEPVDHGARFVLRLPIAPPQPTVET